MGLGVSGAAAFLNGMQVSTVPSLNSREEEETYQDILQRHEHARRRDHRNRHVGRGAIQQLPRQQRRCLVRVLHTTQTPHQPSSNQPIITQTQRPLQQCSPRIYPTDNKNSPRTDSRSSPRQTPPSTMASQPGPHAAPRPGPAAWRTARRAHPARRRTASGHRGWRTRASWKKCQCQNQKANRLGLTALRRHFHGGSFLVSEVACKRWRGCEMRCKLM